MTSEPDASAALHVDAAERIADEARTPSYHDRLLVGLLHAQIAIALRLDEIAELLAPLGSPTPPSAS